MANSAASIGTSRHRLELPWRRLPAKPFIIAQAARMAAVELNLISNPPNGEAT